MKIALLEPLGVSAEMIEVLAAPVREMGHEFVFYPDKTTDAAELLKRSEGCEVIMIANNPLPASVVENADALQMIDVAFTGIDHIALEACRERKLTICNSANYSNQTVAELVIGMTIELLRKLPACDAAVRKQGTSVGLRGREICGRTVGIIGLGNIGKLTAALFQAFGANVIAYNRSQDEAMIARGIRYVSLEELLRESDIVSLHLPNTPETRGMIGCEQFSLMKPDALFINCARGPIVDNQALADALNEEKIAGAAIDVFDMEPPIPADYPLQNAKNCILTPHVAFLSDESMVRRAHIVFDNLLAYLRGEPKNVCKY